MFSISNEELAKKTLIDHHGVRWVRNDFGDLDYLRLFHAVRKSFPTPHEYLEKMVDKHPWVRHWLEYGRSFIAPTRQHCKVMRECGLILESGRCYANYLEISYALREGEHEHDTKNAMYVEGLTITPTGPYRHAWIVSGDRVIDPTWPDAHRIAYFGVEFDPAFARSVAQSVGRYGLIPNWETCSDVVIKHLETREIAQKAL